MLLVTRRKQTYPTLIPASKAGTPWKDGRLS